MGIFDTVNGNFEFPPKVGQSKTIQVMGIETVEDPTGDKNYKSRKKTFDYYHLIDMGNGKKMIINVWSLYFAIKENGCNIGDTITINHPETGKYIVTKGNPAVEPTEWK